MAPSVTLFAAAKSYDPALTSLFASSSGPVKVPEKVVRNSSARPTTTERTRVDDSEEAAESAPAPEDGSSSSSELKDEVDIDRPRKRRRLDDDDLEASYFRRLAEEEQREQQQQNQPPISRDADVDDDTSSEGIDASDDLPAVDEELPVHESLKGGDAAVDKSGRTVFLANVSTTAIKSKSARKDLLDHLESALGKRNENDKSQIESIRFRSTAYVADAGPKRAAFAKKELMEKTAHSTNAYVVFSTEDAARKVTARLNGTIILDRHIRIDNAARSGLIDHRRCVFVGNLPFVDEETTQDGDENEQIKQRRLKGKQPADAEEGLWRAFSKVSKVENVRVVRDKETRVGKGFAYVQFADQNGVEAALLLDGKRFPPMLPRTLRVSRAKRDRPKSKPERGNGIPSRRDSGRFKPPGQKDRRRILTNGGASSGGDHRQHSKLVFEGHRASSQSQTEGKSARRAVKPSGRSARRGASFKASGSKKKSDR